LAGRARECGIERFLGVCLVENREMRELLDDLGPGCRARPIGEA